MVESNGLKGSLAAMLLSGCAAAVALAAMPGVALAQAGEAVPVGALVGAAPPVGKEVAADPLFQQAYIDIDELRDGPVPHRYVHGGFKGTDTRFSFYFPPKEKYQGRFFQYLPPQPSTETIGAAGSGEGSTLGFAVASGGYFAESNLGGRQNANDPTVAGFRASAAAARYSRVIAQKIYGAGRPFGYAYGGSGGAFRTIASGQNTDAWDGIVPYVIGTPMAMPYMFTARVRALRILKDKWPQIVDAVQPGGSGDMYAGLNAEETAALREIQRFGFPAEAWAGYRTMGGGALAVLWDSTRAGNPQYFADYWTKPGFAGSDPASSQAKARVQLRTRVVKLLTADDLKAMGVEIPRPDFGMGGGRRRRPSASGSGGGPFPSAGGAVRPAAPAANGANAAPSVDFRDSTAAAAALRSGGSAPGATPAGPAPFVAIQVEAAPGKDAYLEGARLIANSGAATGTSIPLGVVSGNVIIPGAGMTAMIQRMMGNGSDPSAALLAAIKPGDELQIDNSDYLAAEDYARHQVPDATFYTWNQYRGKDGKPLYPQVGDLQGPKSAISGAGTLQNGKFNGKMIVIEALADAEAEPWSADWYAQRVREVLGKQYDNRFRLLFIEHANHGQGYAGALNQALRDVAAWAEKGIAPPTGTSYRIVDGQVVIPGTAAARKGIQPVVALQANGGKRAEVAVGQSVALTGTIEVPPGTGKVVDAEWEVDGKPDDPVQAALTALPGGGARVSTSYSFDKPGTYFVRLRAYSQREGDTKTSIGRIENFDRVRIVVK